MFTHDKILTRLASEIGTGLKANADFIVPLGGSLDG